MYTDIFGKSRMKINLHMHTSMSDGKMTINEAAAVYKNAGYDAVAITDHWKMSQSGTVEGLRIISGAEYNIKSHDATAGVYHILAINCKSEPKICPSDDAQTIINEINRCGGVAILAHPAWSINTADQGIALDGVDITEIYNSVSDAHESSRPYSGYFVDAAACKGKMFLLTATDDTHYYDGSDETKSYIMLECDKNASDDELMRAIKDGKFYATQGPELHIQRKNNKIIINSSPVSRISLFSNIVWNQGYCIKGENLTKHEYNIKPEETFIRAEVVDKFGRCAWSNIINLKS